MAPDRFLLCGKEYEDRLVDASRRHETSLLTGVLIERMCREPDACLVYRVVSDARTYYEYDVRRPQPEVVYVRQRSMVQAIPRVEVRGRAARGRGFAGGPAAI